MTSKEAFKRIMEKYGETNTLEGTYDYFLVIKKDLEKLDQLEKIEEELGIDLITVFKALKNGIYHKDENNIIEFDSDIEFDYGYYADESTPKAYYFTGDEMYLFNEYGKKWSLDKKELTKEELKND